MDVMTAWRHRPMTGFDLETTGVDVESDRVVTACVALLQPTQSGPWKVEVKSWLVDPGVDIPEAASAVHGITTAHAKEHGEQPPVALDLIAGDLALSLRAGVPIVGMNLAYDLTLLDRELRRYDLLTVEDRVGAPVAPVIDVFCIDKALDRYRPGKRKLTDLCELYGARIDGAHDSSFDALASVRVAWRMAVRAEQDMATLRAAYADRKFPDSIARAWQSLARMSLMDLHNAQVRWYAEQAESLGQYWRQQREEALHRAAVADAEADDEQVAIAEQEAAELAARIDGLSPHWPLKPYEAVTAP